VRRILRHVSPWSVFKFSLVFSICLWLVLTVAGVILWRVAQEAGVITNIERFYAKASGERTFEIDGRGIFRALSGAGVVLVAAATSLGVLLALLFNAVSDLTGGIRMSVIELETLHEEEPEDAAATDGAADEGAGAGWDDRWDGPGDGRRRHPPEA
jgi:hypothetical protein